METETNVPHVKVLDVLQHAHDTVDKLCGAVDLDGNQRAILAHTKQSLKDTTTAVKGYNRRFDTNLVAPCPVAEEAAEDAPGDEQAAPGPESEPDPNADAATEKPGVDQAATSPGSPRS